MSQVEAQIRDFLASDLTFLSKDFILIKKEFPLKNSFGTKGFIDILAEDSAITVHRKLLPVILNRLSIRWKFRNFKG